MSYPGGIATKHGERYEARWTVNCVLAILRGEADSMDLEPIGSEGDGAEFVLVRGDRREYHQVKRRRTGMGHWSLKALKAEGVLASFSRKLREGGYTRFVSEQDADQLRVLSERADDADDLDDFRRLLGGQKWTENFRTLTNHLRLSEADAFEALRRVGVTVLDEEKLKTLNEAWIEPLVDGRPADALADLADIVRDSIPGRLDAATVWSKLTDQYGKHRRRWNVDPTVRQRVDELTQTYLAPLRGVRLRQSLDCPQVGDARALLSGDNLDGVLLTGGAGSGKSDVAVHVIDRIIGDSWPVLCLRADRLAPASTPTEIGDQLGLPGSPASVLAALAEGRPCLLVIDQLDAVSLASGRVTGLWDALYAVICQARANPEMRVLIACRQFDVDNDYRMRALTSEGHELRVVPVTPLDASQVDQAVGAMGLDPATLDERKRALLGVPLHLILLEAVAGESDALDFRTITDLFDRFWRRKQLDANEHAGRSVKWGEVVEAATRYMSDHRSLSLPASQLDTMGLLADASALQSENVLIEDGRAFRFFHESFFDYAFARLYLDTGETIHNLLTGDDQDLFRRAQVRQLLTQQRDSGYQSYLRALSELLNEPDVRFHLKQLVVAWLTAMPDPKREEFDILVSVLGDSGPDDALGPSIWHMFGRAEWFDVAMGSGLVAEWLGGTDPTITNHAVQVLANVVNERTDTVVELLRAHDDGSDMWRERTAYVVRFGDVHHSRALFDVLCDLVRRDAFIASNDHDAWLYGHELPKTQPTWAAELAGVLLDRAAVRARASGERHVFYGGSPLEHEHTTIEFVSELGQEDPALLLSVVLPFLLEVIDQDLEDSDESAQPEHRVPVDNVRAYRLRGETYSFSDTLLATTREALFQVAAEQPEVFLKWASKLRARRDETSQYLLYHGLLGNAAAFADFAAETLLEGSWRYWAADAEKSFWVTHSLLAAIAPHLSGSRMKELEDAIVGFTTPYERSKDGARFRGGAEFELLSGLGAGQLSTQGQRRLGELEHKFGEERLGPPVGIVGGFVGSPIGTEQARHMSDEDWMKAISKHTERWEDKRSMDLVGGADELASVLQTMTQEQPERFAHLAANLPEETLDTYIEHVLIGLAQPGADTTPATLDSVVALCRHVAGWCNTPLARWLPRLVGRYAREQVPDDLVELVCHIATENPDPDRDMWCVDAGSGRPYYGGDVYGAGMNSARGAAALGIAELLVVEENRVDLLAATIAKLSEDPLASVKACAAEAVYALMRWRRDDAIENLLKLVDGPDRLLATRWMQQLMMAGIATHWRQVQPMVERMLASADEDVRETGGALATVAGLDEADADGLLTSALEDADARVRRGVAKVLAARAVSSRYRERCTAGLEKLFDDEDAEVRKEAAKVFWRVRDRQLVELNSVSFAFVASKAFEDNHHHFVNALEVSTADVVDLVLATADRMVVAYGPQLGQLGRQLGGDARDVANLLLRVQGTLDADRGRTKRALDILDRMLEAGAWGVTEALDTVER